MPRSSTGSPPRACSACINIHWDGGWIDSDDKKRFAKTYHTFSPEAERKYQSYWSQIATYFADRDQHLIFESLNEESNFDSEGSDKRRPTRRWPT